MMAEKQPVHFMKQTLALAVEALNYQDFPFAAIVVIDHKVIACGTASNQREKRLLGHARLVASEATDYSSMSVAGPCCLGFLNTV